LGKREKLVQRLCARPNDFLWSELAALLEHFGYKEQKGSGSRRKFIHGNGAIISLHEPHPRKELKAYQMRDVINHLKEQGLL